ncbi:hypothetical protein AA958_01085 [Streptomyces sp. CNQ-509]|nr:hypothetical protein AA958_01085 [Streptomyces sp. CNQ-509]
MVIGTRTSTKAPASTWASWLLQAPCGMRMFSLSEATGQCRVSARTVRVRSARRVRSAPARIFSRPRNCWSVTLVSSVSVVVNGFRPMGPGACRTPTQLAGPGRPDVQRLPETRNGASSVYLSWAVTSKPRTRRCTSHPCRRLALCCVRMLTV